MLPLTDPPVVHVYAGDSCSFHSYTFREKVGETLTPIDLEAEGWTWKAQWRQDSRLAETITLEVDASEAADGRIRVAATAEQTKAMGGPGIWDLEARRPGEVRTFVRGRTTYVWDVTQ